MHLLLDLGVDLAGNLVAELDGEVELGGVLGEVFGDVGANVADFAQGVYVGGIGVGPIAFEAVLVGFALGSQGPGCGDLAGVGVFAGTGQVGPGPETVAVPGLLAGAVGIDVAVLAAVVVPDPPNGLPLDLAVGEDVEVNVAVFLRLGAPVVVADVPALASGFDEFAE